MEEVFLLVNLSTKCNSAFEIEFITETFNSLFSCNYDSLTLKIAIGKFSRLLKILAGCLIAKTSRSCINTCCKMYRM